METITTTKQSELPGQISRANLWETNLKIAEWVRLSGSTEERAAFEYVKGLLDAYGLKTTWLEHPALISLPVEAGLEVDGAGGTPRRYACLTHAFGASVDSIEAEIVDLGAGAPQDYAARPVRGKAVLLDGVAAPTAVFRAEQAGAVAAIFVNDDHLHNMIVSTVWGTPTPTSAAHLPAIPVVSVVQADGLELRVRLAGSGVRARIHTKVSTGWRTTPILVGDLAGQESDEFVMFSGHLDSWDRGAMDNGSANATMLEVGRLLAGAKEDLYRGLRIIFWSGHSHGRYSGSTWYADHNWEELYDRCVAHVNVDSTGARGASYYGRFPAHLELADFGAGVIEEHTAQRARPYRMIRAGDMSFNGIGIPSLFMELSQVPPGGAGAGEEVESDGAIGEMPWWWHTPEDTIDKVDLDVLELDTKIYAATLWRLCHNPLLPLDLRPAVDEVRLELSALQQAAGGELDLSEAQRRAETLLEKVDGLVARSANAKTRDEISALNRQMIALSRILIPVAYTAAGRFDHDPAWDLPCLPGLQGARELAGLDRTSNEYGFLKAELERNRNGVMFALREALEVMG